MIALLLVLTPFNASFIAKAEEKKPDTPIEKKDDSKPDVDPSKKDSADEYYFEVRANVVWTDANKDLLLVVKSKTNDAKTFDNFTGVEIDGKKLDPSNYKAVICNYNS